MNKLTNISAILLLTALASACSIQPLTDAAGSRSKSDPATGETDETNDPNEPENGTVSTENSQNTDQNTKHYKACPEVSACDGVEADCVVHYTTICGDVARADFFCGDRHGYIFTNGAEFECDLSAERPCACAIVDALDYCSALSAE